MHQETLFHNSIQWQNEAHVLGINWRDFTPYISYSLLDDDRIHNATFSNTLELEVSNEKFCIGSNDGSVHVSCPVSTRISGFQRCDHCAEAVIPDQRCIFEPRCQGEYCLVSGHQGEAIEFCSRPHVVYLAFYHDKVKIGMTSGKRVRKRCIEQGADAFLKLSSTDNRFDARQLEKKLAKAHSLRQSFSHNEILRMTTTAIDKGVIVSAMESILSRMEPLDENPLNRLEFLEHYPVRLPLRSVPRETTAPGIHLGKKIGIKGRFLYYESSGLRALNITDIPSRRIQFNVVSFE